MDLGAALKGYAKLVERSEGDGCVMVIKQALKDSQVFVFGELLDAPNVQALSGTSNEPWLHVLKLFAYGTHREYKAKELPVLGKVESQKLKQLSIVSLAEQSKTLSYKLLMNELDIENVRELEDLVIDSIYKGLVKGTLDQTKGVFQVQSAIGRDISPADLAVMMETLANWSQSSNGLIEQLRKHKADAEKRVEERANTETAIKIEKEQVVKDLKTQGNGNDSGNFEPNAGGGFLGSMVGAGMGMMGMSGGGHKHSSRRKGGGRRFGR